MHELESFLGHFHSYHLHKAQENVNKNVTPNKESLYEQK